MGLTRSHRVVVRLRTEIRFTADGLNVAALKHRVTIYQTVPSLHGGAM